MIELKGKVWTIRFLYNGVRKRITNPDWKASVYSKRQMQRIENQEIEKAKAELEEEERKSKLMTFSKAVAMYFEKDSTECKRSTSESKYWRYKNHIAPYFDTEKIPEEALSALKIENYHTKLCKDEKLGESVVNHTFTLFRKIIDFFALNDLLTFENAARYQKMLTPVSTKNQPKTHPENFLSVEEWNAFIGTFDSKEDFYWKVLFETEYWGALRIGEVCGLPYSNVDFQKGGIYINQQMSLHHEITSAKTFSSNGFVALPKEVMDDLAELKLEMLATDYDLVFPNGKTTIRVKMKTHLRKAGISKIVTPHGLRHSMGTRIVESGVISLATASGQLRHSSPQITTRYYVHQLKGCSQEDLKKI